MEPQNQDQSPQVTAPVVDSQTPTLSDDPGKTLGIIGLILAFVGIHLVGLILSILGYKKSKKAGFKNTIALAGIVLNIVFMALFIVGMMILIFFIAIPSIQRIQEAKSTCEELGVGTHQNVSINDTSGSLTCDSNGGFKFSSPNYNLQSS